MIYTIMGNKVKIMQNYGEVEIGNKLVHPVLVGYIEFKPIHTTFYDAYYLKADGGIQEIQKSINGLPVFKLSKKLKKDILECL